MKTVDSFIRRGLIDGAVVLAGSVDRDLFAGAWGFADRIGGVPMSLDTIFDIASVTKAVGTNSVLLAALADELLELDSPFTDLLPGLTGKRFGPVTVRDLVLHISGIDIAYCDSGTPEEMHRTILTTDFVRRPRLEYQYTCTSYILLGFLLEQLYGGSLSDIARERFFRPLGMNDTGWTAPVKGGLARTIRTINADPGIISDPGARHYAPRAFGNAGLFSTAGDLAKFARMMLKNDGSLLPPDVLELCFTDFNPPELNHPHSIGWDKMPDMIPSGLSDQTVFHNGWTGQTLWIDPGTGKFVIVLTNRMKEWGRAKFGRKAIAEELLAIL